MIPSVTLAGSSADRVKTLDDLIAHLERLRIALVDQESAPSPAPELYGPYVDAPVWPWFLAGWTLGAAIVLLFVLAWAHS